MSGRVRKYLKVRKTPELRTSQGGARRENRGKEKKLCAGSVVAVASAAWLLQRGARKGEREKSSMTLVRVRSSLLRPEMPRNPCPYTPLLSVSDLARRSPASLKISIDISRVLRRRPVGWVQLLYLMVVRTADLLGNRDEPFISRGFLACAAERDMRGGERYSSSYSESWEM
ncbi:hypothetical protein ANO11243_055700 [Dothideomycetidae sp. 11243]|nr:hypothetical protein ANO11243_055700 [fungal sp. No.11243]